MFALTLSRLEVRRNRKCIDNFDVLRRPAALAVAAREATVAGAVIG